MGEVPLCVGTEMARHGGFEHGAYRQERWLIQRADKRYMGISLIRNRPPPRTLQ